MTTAEAIIIGGDVNGASTLFHLTQAGVKNSVLVEQGEFSNWQVAGRLDH